MYFVCRLICLQFIFNIFSIVISLISFKNVLLKVCLQGMFSNESRNEDSLARQLLENISDKNSKRRVFGGRNKTGSDVLRISLNTISDSYLGFLLVLEVLEVLKMSGIFKLKFFFI